MPTRVAACVCEQLTVSCSGDPAHVSLCHCLIAAFFPRENVRVAGDATAYTRQSESGYPITLLLLSPLRVDRVLEGQP